MRTPELITLAAARPYRSGEHRCYYCGGQCSDDNPSSDFVPSTFTAHNTIARPGAPYVCDGCVWTQRIAETLVVEGETREGQRPWSYSWLLTASLARPLTKTHIAILRDACLNPPEPPFSIVLAVSGQRHLLYLAPVNDSRASYSIALESEVIATNGQQLAARIDLTSRIGAAVGKPRLAEAPAFSVYRDVMARYRDGESMVDEWSRIWCEPVSRLAVFLTDKKEVCCDRYPSDAAA